MFSLSGCGYKAPPYYETQVPEGDENVKFIIEEKKIVKNENNESCE
ncbi:hypothetical protein JHD49_04560 [Sulfurimonas sp. SAG-AH-194-C21]|nr:hypothetical protein [Sulfurimonas sp. SAG-AH-194-C21]MDF1883204.1 hypothetical protein [Sulfurimonas sp. SAG-AH-194-C21]